MTPRAKGFFSRTQEEKQPVGSLEDLVLIPVNAQKRKENGDQYRHNRNSPLLAAGFFIRILKIFLFLGINVTPGG